MRARLVFVVSALAAGSCIVPIDDVEEDTGTGGTAGQSGAGTGGASAAGGNWSGGAGGASGGAGGTAAAGTGGSSGDASAGAGGTTGGAGGTAGAGASGGAGGSAGTGGSGGAPACVVGVADDFNDGTIASTWWPFTDNTNVTVVETSGVLRFSMPTLSAPAYSGLQTSTLFDLTGCSTSVHVVDAFSSATAAYTSFTVRYDQDYLEFLQSGAKLVAKRWAGGSATVIVEGTFDLMQNAWWRFRESGGVVHFEVASDGKSYKPFATSAPPFDPTKIRIQLMVGAYKPENNPGDASFDDFNVTPP